MVLPPADDVPPPTTATGRKRKRWSMLPATTATTTATTTTTTTATVACLLHRGTRRFTMIAVFVFLTNAAVQLCNVGRMTTDYMYVGVIVEGGVPDPHQHHNRGAHGAGNNNTNSTGRPMSRSAAQKEQPAPRQKTSIIAITNSTNQTPTNNDEGETNKKAKKEEEVTPNERRGRLKFVLHVGLPKTGTTFLQCSVCAYGDVAEPVLLEDNFVFLGTCPFRTCGLDELPPQFLKHRRSSFVSSGTSRDSHFNKYGPIVHTSSNATNSNNRKKLSSQKLVGLLSDGFVERVRRLHEQGRNALVIFEGCENLEDRQIQALAHLLLADADAGYDWDVRILVAYRPLYQWLPSKYNSVRKPGRSKTHNQWPGLPLERRPDLNGTAIVPFDVEDRDDFTTLVEYIADSSRQHPTETTRNNYALHFGRDRVEVLPLHRLPEPITVNRSIGSRSSSSDIPPLIRPDPLVHYLFCLVLVNDTPHTCRAVRSGVIGNTAAATSSNPSVTLNYDMLATAAYEAGMLLIPRNKTPSSGIAIKRAKVRDKIAKFQERKLNLTSDDFPLVCLPNATLSWLERLSLDLELSLFRNDSSASTADDLLAAEAEQQHRTGMERSRAKKVFCSIDTRRTLDDPRWRSFFAAVADRNRRRSRSRRHTTPKRKNDGNGEEDVEDVDVDGGSDDDDLLDDDEFIDWE